MSNQLIRSVCPHDCPSTCALQVEQISRHEIGRVRGNPDNDYTAGVICSKVSNYRERIHHPERLTKPMRRIGAKGEGAFEVITWEEALDEVAGAFQTSALSCGPESVWPYDFAGTMGLIQRGSIHRLRHAFGYSLQEDTICVTTGVTGWNAGVGTCRGSDSRNIQHSDLIVVWGGNPVSTQVNLMTHISRARKKRGAKLVVVDAYQTPSADVADMHLMPKPGTDGALACAVMHVLFKEKFADWEYMEQYTDCPDRLERHLKTRTPEWAEKISGIPASDIVSFARLYGSNPRSFLRCGYGFTRSRNGPANMHAVSCLPAITGAWQHKGGGALYSNRDLYDLNFSMSRALDLRSGKTRTLDMSRIGAVLNGERESLKNGPPVKAMLVQNVNPADVAPDSNLVRKGLVRDDLFLCVHEQFMTETAKFADILLPATMFLEHDDLYTGSAHVYLQAARKVVEAPGQCRSNVDVINELGKRLGSEYPGFYMTARELIEQTLLDSGLPDSDDIYEMGWVDCSKSFDDMNFLTGFAHPEGRFRFAPDWSEQGEEHESMPSLPDHFEVYERATPEHPFRLVAAPARRYLNTSFTEMPSSRRHEGRPTIKIHENACKSLDISDGQLVCVGNSRGQVKLHASIFGGLQEDVVVVESIWPGSSFEGGVGINALIGADRAFPGGGAVFHDTAVWVRPEN